MRITPERAELIMEAVQLRGFGWTQQQIADDLKVPKRTVGYWLKNIAHDMGNNVAQANDRGNGSIAELGNITPHPIRLFPCRYEEAAPRIEPGSIDLILTDPPYLVSNTDMSRKNQADLQRDFGNWDNIPQEQYAASVSMWAGLMAQHLRKGGSLYLFIGYRQSFLWGQSLEKAGLSYNGLLVWHRANPAPQIRKTRWCPAFDFILFYSKGSPDKFRWIGQNEMHNVIRCVVPEIEAVWTGAICAGNERQWHPTQKPRWLLEKILFISSAPGTQVLDPFAGSGSTAFAAQRLSGRQVTLIEPEPKYVGLIQSIAKEEFQCNVTLETI
jgi:site-specific DNA-methyltransferase (adenine-specific)